MRKRLIVPVLTALLIIVSVASAWAQTDAEGGSTAPLFFVVMDPIGDGSGRFTPFFEIDGGNLEVVEDTSDDRSVERVLRLDPTPPGGDTFDIRTSGRTVGLGTADGLQIIELRWDIMAGTGSFKDLTGGGSVVSALLPGETPRVSVYSGSTARAVAGGEHAKENWQAIQRRIKIKKLIKRGGDAARTQQTQTKALKKVRKQNQRDIDFLTELGSQDCYAEAYDALLGSLNDLDRGLELKMGFDPDAGGLIFLAQTRLDEFDKASDLVEC